MAKRKSGVSVGMDLLNGDSFIKELEKFTLSVQNEVIVDAIEAGTKPVLTAMIANTPESSGSRQLQSSKTKQKWSGSKKLKTTIKAVVRRSRRLGITSGAMGIVGPSYTDGGGHGNLFSKDHKRKVNWGRDSGGVRVVNQFVKKTADQSAAQAKAALSAALKSGIDREASKMRAE